ncbi:SEC-C domain-containing protein [Actinomadura alba]|nr:SEC-C domain-containing protein [Actinomadura alba]
MDEQIDPDIAKPTAAEHADSPRAERRRRQALKQAESLERDAAAYPDEREEILLEAAAQWSLAGEDQRALDIYDDLAATASHEDAQWATASQIDVLAKLGRHEDVEAEIARLKRADVHSGPASIVAEFLEAQGRLEDALTWFNIACRDLPPGQDEEITETALIVRSELQGRARVRKALGLPPDALDQQVTEGHAELVRTLDRAAPSSAAGQPVNAGSFFVREDVKRAFAEDLVHVDAPGDDDVASYFRRVEKGWRATTGELGTAGLRILPITVDDVLKYGAEQGRDPRDQQTRADHLQDRIAEGAPTLAWPPERNAACWCGSDRKYKKCCGSPNNR